MSSLFHVPDKRIVLANNTLYKVCVTRGGPLHHPDDTVSAEIEELLRAIIPLVSQCSNLKLQTEHLLAHYHLTTWSLPRKIQFEKQNILIDAHHRVINIAVLSKKQNGNIAIYCNLKFILPVKYSTPQSWEGAVRKPKSILFMP